MVSSAVVDFSAFVGSHGRTIIKELSIGDVASMCVQHWVFKPPHDATVGWNNAARHNTWLSKHYHGIDFHAGFTEYENLKQILQDMSVDVRLLYTPTADKAKVLESLLDRRAVFSLEELGCPRIPCEWLPVIDEEDEVGGEEGEELIDPAPPCLWHYIHAPGFNCTQSNVRLLCMWCAENPGRIDMHDVAVREVTFKNNWPHEKPTPRQLAEQGFIRLCSTKDTTKCVYCGVLLFRWEAKDVVADDHDYNSPFCKFLRYTRQQRRDSPPQHDSRPAVTSKELSDLCRC